MEYESVKVVTPSNAVVVTVNVTVFKPAGVPKSQLEIVATDFRPMVEIIFSKRSLENQILNLEDFISVKGIKAIGNQLTNDKIKQVNLLDSLPYEEPKVNAVEVIEEEEIKAESIDNSNPSTKKDEDDSDGQTALF